MRPARIRRSVPPPRWSGRLGHPTGVAPRIVRGRLDGCGRKWLRCVGEQLPGVVRHGLVRIDLRIRLRQWRNHATSQPVRRPDRGPVVHQARDQFP